MTTINPNMTTEELLIALTELEHEIDETTAKFDTDVTEIRAELNKEFAAADKALDEFVEELGRTDDLDTQPEEEPTK